MLDVELKYSEYLFKLGDHSLYTFDICGACEAHAMLSFVNYHGAVGVADAPTLSQMDPKLRLQNLALKNCPSEFY